MKNCTIEYHDAGPDSQGRRFFTLRWEEPGGEFRPQPDPEDSQPVGYRRGQCFFADPSYYLAQHSISLHSTCR